MNIHYTVDALLYINFSNHVAKVDMIILLLLLLLFRMVMWCKISGASKQRTFC